MISVPRNNRAVFAQTRFRAVLNRDAALLEDRDGMHRASRAAGRSSCLASDTQIAAPRTSRSGGHPDLERRPRRMPEGLVARRRGFRKIGSNRLAPAF